MTQILLINTILVALTSYLHAQNNMQIVRFILAAKSLDVESGTYMTTKPAAFYRMFLTSFLSLFFTWPIVLYALTFSKGVEKDIIEGVEH